jgi:hypothetical protein
MEARNLKFVPQRPGPSLINAVEGFAVFLANLAVAVRGVAPRPTTVCFRGGTDQTAKSLRVNWSIKHHLRKRMGSGDPSGLQNRRELASLALVSSTLTRFRHFLIT